MFFDRSEKSTWDVEARLEALRDEISALSKDVAKSGRRSYASARDTGHELLSEIPDAARKALPVARRSARAAERTVRDNPTTTVAVAGLVLLGLAATVIYSRR